MSTSSAAKLISVRDYLAGELASQVKHEYLAGVIYAMAGARNVHNLISGNFFGLLHARLRGKPCRPYNSDTKIRIQLPTHVRFYYPDVSVICDPNSPEDSFQDQPAVVAEVLSRRTRRIDEGEKKDAYLAVPSLSCYLLIEQEQPAVTLYRRTEQGFVREVITGLDATIRMSEIDAELPLAEIYDGVIFSPEPDDDHTG
jgi:Uma2 family endonuclease